MCMITVFESELVAVRRLSLGKIEINEVLAERLKRIATAKNVKLYSERENLRTRSVQR